MNIKLISCKISHIQWKIVGQNLFLIPCCILHQKLWFSYTLISKIASIYSYDSIQDQSQYPIFLNYKIKYKILAIFEISHPPFSKKNRTLATHQNFFNKSYAGGVIFKQIYMKIDIYPPFY